MYVVEGLDYFKADWISVRFITKLMKYKQYNYVIENLGISSFLVIR